MACQSLDRPSVYFMVWDCTCNTWNSSVDVPPPYILDFFTNHNMLLLWWICVSLSRLPCGRSQQRGIINCHSTILLEVEENDSLEFDKISTLGKSKLLQICLHHHCFRVPKVWLPFLEQSHCCKSTTPMSVNFVSIQNQWSWVSQHFSSTWKFFKPCYTHQSKGETCKACEQWLAEDTLWFQHSQSHFHSLTSTSAHALLFTLTGNKKGCILYHYHSTYMSW